MPGHVLGRCAEAVYQVLEKEHDMAAFIPRDNLVLDRIASFLPAPDDLARIKLDVSCVVLDGINELAVAHIHQILLASPERD